MGVSMGYLFTYKPHERKHEVLEQLYIQYGKLMYHVAFDILHDRYLAEDAVQTAFLKLEQTNFSIDTVSCNKTKSFMVIIVRNIAIGIYNSKKKTTVTYEADKLTEIPDDNLLPLDIAISNESIKEIQDALNTIEPIYADVILMRYFSDYSNTEIALLFDISEQLVRVRLHRAKKLILQRLNEGEANEQA